MRPMHKASSPSVDDPKRWLRGLALGFLARREHSQQELTEKLLDRAGEHAALVEEVVALLSRERLVSDERFAEAYIRYRSGRGYGPVVIRQQLRQKGVSPLLVSAGLDSGEYDWVAQAQVVVRKRFGMAPAADWTAQAKRLRFLQYRGFTSDQCTAALGDDSKVDQPE